MDDDQQFCLRWNNHQSTLISVFDTLLENEKLVDCTLAAEGKFLKAHKVVLSACSPYFATLLQEQYDKHPIFILKDVKYQELRAMMDYMYRGEVNISQDQLAALLKAAESLQIKGLSDNRTGGSSGVTAPKPEQHHRGLNVPVAVGGKLTGGYTLEQTKRARIGPTSMDSQDMTASREGSSSPSRRRRKVRRRSIENIMTEIHDNSNSSQLQAANQALLQQQANASLANVAATVLATQIPVTAATTSTGQSGAAAVAATIAASSTQQLTTSVTKKTECVKGTSDAMNTENVQAGGVAATGADDQEMEHVKGEKHNHKQKSGAATAAAGGPKEATELVIEPKSEYEEEGNDETVEDLTLDDEDMGMDDLDQNAGTSQGGEGSSQGYAPWQHDRSQEEILLATQEAQQRDPQDLSRKIIEQQLLKENTAPPLAPIIQKSNQRSILNANKRLKSRNSTDARRQSKSPQEVANVSTAAAAAGPTAGAAAEPKAKSIGNRKRLSVTDVSDMLFEFYKANVAKAPKNQQQTMSPNKLGQSSPTSAETHEPSTIAAIATNGAANGSLDTASKNLQSDEMMPKPVHIMPVNNNGNASFHPRIKYTNKAAGESAVVKLVGEPQPDTKPNAIPTSVVVPIAPEIDMKPLIDPITGLVISPRAAVVDAAAVSTSVIKPVAVIGSAGASGAVVVPQAAAIAAALLRDGYHNFQQQMRAQELLKHQSRQQSSSKSMMVNSRNATPTKMLENFLRQQRDQRLSECDNEQNAISDTNDGDDEEDSRFNGFEDIHLVEKTNFSNSSLPNLFQFSTSASSPATVAAAATAPATADYLSDESQKLIIAAQAQAQAMRKYEYSVSDYGGTAAASGMGIAPSAAGEQDANSGDGEPVYECRHCGKKYRWKSTLRRHENVECGGKEPSHQCPYCPYRSKQRGNLGVHVRKHHQHLPQLASKRRSKYSAKYENSNGGAGSANASDDSQNKLVIDCSK